MVIKTAGVYTNGDLIVGLSLSRKTLEKARSAGRLRYARKGHTLLYRGQWVIDWIEGREPVIAASLSVDGPAAG